MVALKLKLRSGGSEQACNLLKYLYNVLQVVYQERISRSCP